MVALRAISSLVTLLALGCGARSGLAEGEQRDERSTDAGATHDATPTEACDGRDDDDDGVVDEVCECGFRERRSCESEPPDEAAVLCERGTQRCLGGAWGPCEGVVFCELVEERFSYDDRIDFVLIVDQSESMRALITHVRENIDRLAASMAASEREYRVHLIASPDAEHAICIPPPLGGPACTGSERLHRIDEEVGSGNALELFRLHLADIEAATAPRSQRVLVVVSEDDSSTNPIELHRELITRAGWHDYVFFGAVGTLSSTCRIADASSVYPVLARNTAGAIYDICSDRWGSTLGGIVHEADARPRRYRLARQPVDAPRVLAGAPPVDLARDLFHFDDARRAVTVEPAALPPGTPLIVRYLAARP